MLFSLAFLVGVTMAPVGNQWADSTQEKTKLVAHEGSIVKERYKELWDLCNAVYSEYPYLYTAAGKDYVYKYYLDSFENSPSAKVICAFDPETQKLVGFATGIRMSDYTAEHYKKPFLHKGVDPQSVYYIADLVLLANYRDKGYEQQMCEALEEHAKHENSYQSIAYLLIDEKDRTKHLMPQDSKLYKPYFAPFWEKRKYTKSDISFVTTFEIVGETEETPHSMTYWLKALHQ